ncbi:putative CD20-like family-containing protein [Homarus americanus]|uniref:Putative CD20-like family-containing protein n=1 Tax=Homarus americanus TaxID=6706 RepID=A0A8J5JXY3_HOMAM|nr:putative CD20-like family-containing protein [Homarus americanus]
MGVWAGLSTTFCGMSGLVAHRLWYKNFTIKTFLVSSVVSVVINVLAIILTIYAIVNRKQHYFHLLDQAENNPWFQPYDLDKEHRLTLSVSANQLVGFTLELVLALWSAKIGWRGVHAPEFSAANRDSHSDDLRSVASLPRHGQQVPLAALYQLLQTHPELLGNKSLGGGLGTPWSTGLDERPSHLSMDYQERVTRFLSHAIEDQNVSFSRSPSTLRRETRDASSPTASSSITGSGGRGSPAETVVMLSDPPFGSSEQKQDIICIQENPETERKQRSNKLHRNNAEHKVKAPAPKVNSKIKENDNSIASKKPLQTEVAKVVNTTDGERKVNAENDKKSDITPKKENEDQKKVPVTEVKEEDIAADANKISDHDQTVKFYPRTFWKTDPLASKKLPWTTEDITDQSN